MIFNNLKTIFSQLSFLAPHEDDNEAIKIEWHDSNLVSVCFFLAHLRSRRNSRHEPLDIIPDWQIYPLIKLILNYLDIEYQKFYDVNIKIDDISLNLGLTLIPEENNGLSTLTDKQSNDIFARTLPTPLTHEGIISKRNNWTDFIRRYSSESYSFSYISPQDTIRVEPISWTTAANAAPTFINDISDPLP